MTRYQAPTRYCAHCGHYVGHRWKDFVLCRKCLKDGIEQSGRALPGLVEDPNFLLTPDDPEYVYTIAVQPAQDEAQDLELFKP